MEKVVIEWDHGIRHFAGREDLYIKYLNRFLEDKHFYDAKEAFEKKDMISFKREIHSLKGLAGTLGLMDVFWHAFAVSNVADVVDAKQIEEKIKRIQ